MNKLFVFIFVFFISYCNVAQTFSPVQVIDQGSHIGGITSINTVDLNNDSLIDILVSQGYNHDKVSYYLNQGQGNFSNIQYIDTNALNVEAVKAADFNEDGWLDVISLCRFDSSIYFYPNNNGNFSQRIKIDSTILRLNDLTIHDFDGDNHEDIVVIGQHSIDIFFGDGNGNFSKNHILTTSTSPNSLECIDLEKVDMNNDGKMDLLVAETLGAVVYINNGSGSFSPHTINIHPLTGNLVHPFDMDNDNDFDVLLRYSSGNWKLFKNDGNSNYTNLGNRNNLSNFQSLQSLDFNNDTMLDLYGTYMNQIDLFYNDSLHNFSANSTAYQNNNINFIYESDTSDLNQNGITDIIFAAVSGYLAWHEFNASTSIKVNKVHDQTLIFYPNPARKTIQLKTNKVKFLEIYNTEGKLISHIEYPKNEVSIESLDDGIYIIYAQFENKILTQFLVKE